MHYHPRPDGSSKFMEGWVMDTDGEVQAAQITTTPWMRDMRPSGEDVSFAVKTSGGDVRIEGETVSSTFHPARQRRGDAEQEGASLFTHLQQGTARYRWNDEQAFGMIERSYIP
jgi:hypothetical protein